MRIIELAQNLTPVFNEDNEEWEELKSSLDNPFQILWYAASSFDFEPIFNFETGKVPDELGAVLKSNPLYIMTDYSVKFTNAIKGIYSNFDRESFDLSHYDGIYGKYHGIEIEQMIPLRLFNKIQLIEMRQKYTHFHESVTTSVVPDEHWHFCYISALVERRYSINVVLGLIENLVFFEEVIKKYQMPLEVFCALRVGGKSGSWDYTHSPSKGKLWKAIEESSVASLKPKYWIADDCFELRKIWREINPHERGFYGEPHYFRTKW